MDRVESKQLTAPQQCVYVELYRRRFRRKWLPSCWMSVYKRYRRRKVPNSGLKRTAVGSQLSPGAKLKDIDELNITNERSINE